MHLGKVKKYLKSKRLHEILNDDLDLLCNSLDLDMRAYMIILLVFCVCNNGTHGRITGGGLWPKRLRCLCFGLQVMRW
jgi:hypothetical protein